MRCIFDKDNLIQMCSICVKIFDFEKFDLATLFLFKAIQLFAIYSSIFSQSSTNINQVSVSPFYRT